MEERLSGLIKEMLKKLVKEAVEEALSDLDLGGAGEYYPEVLDLKQAAEYLKVSKGWLYQNLDSIPHSELGGKKFVRDHLKQLCIDKTGRRFALKDK